VSKLTSPARRAELLWRRNATLGTIMHVLAEIHGDRRLVTEPDAADLSYLEAADRVDRWAAAIARQVAPGDRVLLATPNRYDQFLLSIASARAGALAVPVNAQMRPDEIAHVRADCAAALTVSDPTDLDRIAAGAPPLTRPADADPGEVAALFYTSGTTGRPKGAELSHRALLGSTFPGLMWPSGLRDDECVVSLPVAHIMGFAVLLGLAVAGIPVYFLHRFKPDEVLDALEARRSSSFIGVPAMYRMLLEAGAEGRDLSSVRIWGSGADAMPADLAHRFKRFGATARLPRLGAVGEAMFVEGYGMVELGGGAAFKVSPPLMDLGLGGEALGIGLPGFHLKVVDDRGALVPIGEVGELLIKGPGVLKGYWNSPDATRAAVTDDGWLRTGDLARRGLWGTVVFVGRTKDVIKTGGYSVYALEVQTTLEEHPDVLEAAVIGLPDDRLGQVPAAVVRLAEGVALDSLGLDSWAADRLARYKVPRRFVAVEELPRTGTRKVQKRELLDLFPPVDE
jgi:acyl-CoA synthetase (AMP-forming)/AMP-acid ligase II